MCLDMHIEMCIDMCIDMHIDVCLEPAFASEWASTLTLVHGYCLRIFDTLSSVLLPGTHSPDWKDGRGAAIA